VLRNKARGIHCARDMTYRMQGVASRKASSITRCGPFRAPLPHDLRNATAFFWPTRDRVAHESKSLLKVCRLVSIGQVVIDFLHLTQNLLDRFVHAMYAWSTT